MINLDAFLRVNRNIARVHLLENTVARNNTLQLEANIYA